jgi:glycosyltransferase involved in cell wall biosynthesis
MRALLVISDLALHGAQGQVVELARELDPLGHRIAIYTLNDDVPRARALQGTGVEVFVDQKRMKLDPAVIMRLRRRIVSWNAEIVHGFLYDADIYVRLAAIGTGATVLNSERSDDYTLSRIQMLAHRLTRPLVDGVVANSRSGSAFAQRYFGYAPQRMHVVWNGLRVDEIERKAVSSVNYREEFFGAGDFKLATMIGHIKPAKDYHLALDTAAALVRRAPEWRVLFLGDALSPRGGYAAGADSDTSGYRASVLEHFRRLDIADKVKFAGMRPDAHAILAQSDVQLMTSCREGFPNVVLEGMVLGVPIVSTDYSDIRLILPRPAQVVSSRSPQDLADAILEASRHRAAIAAEQKRWVRAHASIEHAAREMQRVYEHYLRRDACAHAA